MPQTKKQKAIVRRWVKNLKSGEYKQGADFLVFRREKHDEFCCLGVLCDMAVRAGVIVAPNVPDVGHCYVYDGDNNTSLPHAVQDWVGLGHPDGICKFSCLASMNDRGIPFKTIANLIESNPPGLFV